MINKVTLLGYIGDEPEVRSFEGGSRMARIRIATNEKIFSRKSGEWRQHTEWHTVIFWSEAATFVDKYIHKGTQAYIEGALRSREATTKEGSKVQIIEIVGREIKVLNQPKSNSPQPLKKEATPKITPPVEDLDNLPF